MTELREYAPARTPEGDDRVAFLSRHPRDVVWVIDATFKITYVSPSVERILGYTPEEFAAMSNNDVIHADDLAVVDKASEEVRIHPGAETRLEVRVRHRDGGWRWVEVLAVNLLDDPVIAGVLCVFRDVTDRHDAEAALRASEERFRALVQHSADGMVMLSAEGRLTYVSPAAERVTGFSPAEMLERDDGLWFVHPDDQPGAQAALARCLDRPGTPVIVELRVRRRDGDARWVEAIATNLLDNPDVLGIVVNFRDIGDRREAEEALRASEERFRALIEHSGDAIVVLDREATITWASESVGRVLGYEPGEIVGRHGFDLVHPSDAGVALTHFAAILEGELLPDALIIRIRTRDGGWLWMDVVGSDVLDNPKVQGIAVNLRDASASVQANDALRASEERFRALVQHASDVVQILDGEGVVTWTSPAVTVALGYEPEDLLGRKSAELCHPDDIDTVVNSVTDTLKADGAVVRFNTRVRHADGSWRWIEVQASNRLNDPSVRGIVANYHDITEQLAAQRDTDRLSAIIGATTDLVAVTHRSGKVLYMNAASRAFFELDPDAPLEDFDFRPFSPPWVRDRYLDEVLPIVQERGIWSGELAWLRRGLEVPVSAVFLAHRDAEGAVEFISSVVRDISERKAFEARLEHEATHDPLTALPNRTLLLDRLEVALGRAERSGQCVAVLFCDLDHFKVVNDSLGHGRGDRLLCALAERLRALVRPGDTVARFGGDELVVLCDGLSSDSEALTIARRIEVATRRPFTVEDSEVFVTVSIGIACTAPGGATAGVDPESLIRDADAAMYRAKAAGRNRSALFDVAMRASALERLDIEMAMRRALERRELRVLYQPKINLDTGGIVGVEALLRWEHPERGLLEPNDFLHVAEETGLIVPIGGWVLRTACQQVARLNALRPGRDPLYVSVNLAARQLEHPALIQDLAAVLASTGIDPAHVDLEITESVVMRDPTATEATLRELKGLGVKLAVDDFGTGYSSLAYLRRFPVDLLKIDRAFVDGLARDPEDTAICAAVVSLAHSLGLAAIAEGVESADQLAQLRELGCDMAQGFLMSAPLTIDKLEELLDTDPSW